MATVELSFSALPEHVRTARLVASNLGRRSGVPDELIDEVKLAVGEACARAVGIHQRHAPGRLVDVTITDDEQSFTVTVADCGPPGDDVAAAEANERIAVADLLDDTDGDGWGGGDEAAGLPAGLRFALIEGLVDDLLVAHRDDDEGTVVTMRWNLIGKES